MKVPQFKSESNLATETGSGSLSVQANPGALSAGESSMARLGTAGLDASIKYYENEQRIHRETTVNDSLNKLVEEVNTVSLDANEKNSTESINYFNAESNKKFQEIANNIQDKRVKQIFNLKGANVLSNARINMQKTSRKKAIDENLAISTERENNLILQATKGNNAEKMTAMADLFGVETPEGDRLPGIYETMVSNGVMSPNDAMARGIEIRKSIKQNSIINEFENIATVADKRNYLENFKNNPPVELLPGTIKKLTKSFQNYITTQENLEKTQTTLRSNKAWNAFTKELPLINDVNVLQEKLNSLQDGYAPEELLLDDGHFRKGAALILNRISILETEAIRNNKLAQAEVYDGLRLDAAKALEENNIGELRNILDKIKNKPLNIDKGQSATLINQINSAINTKTNVLGKQNRDTLLEEWRTATNIQEKLQILGKVNKMDPDAGFGNSTDLLNLASKLESKLNSDISELRSESKSLVDSAKSMLEIIEAGGAVSEEDIKSSLQAAAAINSVFPGIANEALESINNVQIVSAAVGEMVGKKPSDMDQIVQQFVSGIPGMGEDNQIDTGSEAKIFKTLSKYASTAKSQLSKDPMTWATKQGIIPGFAPIELDNPESLKLRMSQATKVAEHYNLPTPRFFTGAELIEVSKKFQNSNITSAQKIKIIDDIIEGVGIDNSEIIFSQMGTKGANAEIYGSLGGLRYVARKFNLVDLNETANIAMIGMENIGLAGELGLTSTNIAEGQESFLSIIGNSMSGNENLIESIETTIEVAKAIYIGRALTQQQDRNVFNTDLWANSLQEAFGRTRINNEEYGGIETIRGNQVFLAPYLRAEDLENVLDNFQKSPEVPEEIAKDIRGGMFGSSYYPVAVDGFGSYRLQQKNSNNILSLDGRTPFIINMNDYVQ